MDAANSKGFPPGVLSHTAPGHYCIDNLGFTPRNAVASAGFNGDAIASVVALGSVGPCSPTRQISVGMYDVNGAQTDNDFMIIINN